MFNVKCFLYSNFFNSDIGFKRNFLKKKFLLNYIFSHKCQLFVTSSMLKAPTLMYLIANLFLISLIH